MAAIDTYALPLLPLSSGVVLPGMVVTLALETPEAIAAADAAQQAGGQLVLLPRIGTTTSPDDLTSSDDTRPDSSGRYARVGTVARLDGSGQLPGGTAPWWCGACTGP